MHDIVKVFSTLSDETRLRILNVLLKRECCVCEVMQALGISQSRASRNLRILYDAGFLKMRKEGLWALYSLDEGRKDYLEGLVQSVGKALVINETAKQDVERLRKARRVGVSFLKEMEKGVILKPSKANK